MFWRIILCVIISETILVASSDNGLLNTITLENNNTPAKHPINANLIRKWLERKNFSEDPSTPTNFNYVSQSNIKDDGRADVSFQKAGNAEQTAVFKKILIRWASLLDEKLKNQIPVLKSNDQYSQFTNVPPQISALKILKEGGFFDESSSINEKQLNKEDSIILTTEHLTPRPRMENLELLSPEVENVQLTTVPEESIMLKNENKQQTIALNKVASNVEKKKSNWQNGSTTINVEWNMKQPLPIPPISKPWVEQYVIGNANLPNSEGKKHATEKEILRKKKNHALIAIKASTERTTVTPESIFQNWGLLLLDSKKNKLFDEEHDQLVNELEKSKLQPEATQTLLESAEVDDDRNKVLREKVETWYDNLQTRREIFDMGVSPELRNIVRFRRNLQSALAALFQKRLLSELQRSHAVDYRKQSKWRRQLLSQYSTPQSVDYRRLLSLWQKELRRQLKIKWNRRPLVEISPGAFKTDIYVNPPDDLSKHMQKLLALKKRQEERNRDLNAGRNEDGQ